MIEVESVAIVGFLLLSWKRLILYYSGKGPASLDPYAEAFL